ncbi:hypothetical protein F5984_15560 [Rudanella paleaurantiibacter]|uniref:Uncharacterized protein n=2 Tax=Rudanella paleaurantiibacter TaxID=2614655 RepID=A0A7J5TXU1_9BACT|nr:hypothetical protein F5984_15560 [Rudanella paleaurantiibacter]
MTSSLTLLTVTPSALQYNWGIDGLVLWIEDLSSDNSLLARMPDLLQRIGFAIELQTGWDHRYDSGTLHPLYGYRILLRDGTGLWHAIRVDEAGRFVHTVPLEELDYEIAYDMVMWVDL